ncbi:AAA family ATPase [candidate division KSB1 bacterium]|nr:AAA family ATPase [candidate division KSB1 bacterium]
MFDYHPRWIAPLFGTMIEEASIVVLTGPRQVGKSTLIRNELDPSFRILNLDDLDILSQIKDNPTALLHTSDFNVIDEAQRAPALRPGGGCGFAKMTLYRSYRDKIKAGNEFTGQ